jgi:hypothetical protein
MIALACFAAQPGQIVVVFKSIVKRRKPANQPTSKPTNQQTNAVW